METFTVVIMAILGLIAMGVTLAHPLMAGACG
jgi:hypothetical protein